MTSEDLQRLYELQTIDTAIGERETLLAEADDGTTALQALEEARAELEQLEKDLHAKQARHRQLELDLETILADRQERSERCYGGMVSDPKELSALQAKIEELGRNADRHEDMILELLEEIDILTERVAAQKERVAELEARHAKIVEVYESSTTQAREEITELRERRDSVVAAIDDALVREYEQLRSHLGGIAVAALRDGTCAVCNVAVSRTRQSMVAKGMTLVKCESCRRILVCPPEDE